MKKQILMPALSPTMKVGKLVKWNISPGSKVSSGDIIAEIETDKATMELESFYDGVICEILVQEGQGDIPVNSVIADIKMDESEESEDESPALKPLSSHEFGSKDISLPIIESKSMLPQEPKNAVKGTRERLIASPVARKIARENNIDLSTIPAGSGPGGRIIKSDLDNIHSSIHIHEETRQTRKESLSSTRRVIAERLSESKQTIPHFYLTVECNASELLLLRKKINDAKGVRITINDFMVKAVASAMLSVPEVNCRWDDDGIIYYDFVDISIAVALDDGLVTPIVFDVSSKNILQVAKYTQEVIAKARNRKLLPADYEGGNFTISNLGMFGISNFSAIINPPQACILSVGSLIKRPEFDGDGNIIAVDNLSCTLSVDHRAVDGATAAKFLVKLKEFIQDPVLILV